MRIATIPISIKVKDGLVLLEDNSIPLYQYQINQIKKHAVKRTKKGWLSTRNPGIKIQLSFEQREQLVEVKNKIITFLSPAKDPKIILSKRNGISFSKHSTLRILDRIERLTPEEIEALGKTDYLYAIHPETLEKIVESLINSNTADSYAEWKGYPYLNYSFLCSYDDREIRITVNLENGILLITLIVDKETGYYIGESYSLKENKKKNTF